MFKKVIWIVLFSVVVVFVLSAAALVSYKQQPEPGSPAAWQRALNKAYGPPEHTKVDRNHPLHEQTRVFEIAGRTFEIPIMYILGSPKPGIQQEGMLLQVIWPDMRSIHELQDRAEYERIWREERRLGTILIESAEIRPPLDEQINNRRRRLAKEEFLGEHNGIREYLWYRGPQEKPEPWSIVHILKSEDGEIISVNECSRSKGTVVPGCRHKFVHGGLIYVISYNEAVFLSEAQHQRQRAVEFINQLEMKSYN